MLEQNGRKCLWGIPYTYKGDRERWRSAQRKRGEWLCDLVKSETNHFNLNISDSFLHSKSNYTSFMNFYLRVFLLWISSWLTGLFSSYRSVPSSIMLFPGIMVSKKWLRSMSSVLSLSIAFIYKEKNFFLMTQAVQIYALSVIFDQSRVETLKTWPSHKVPCSLFNWSYIVFSSLCIWLIYRWQRLRASPTVSIWLFVDLLYGTWRRCVHSGREHTRRRRYTPQITQYHSSLIATTPTMIPILVLWSHLVVTSPKHYLSECHDEIFCLTQTGVFLVACWGQTDVRENTFSAYKWRLIVGIELTIANFYYICST